MDQARAQARQSVERARLTTRRAIGLDRSGPPPPETLRGRPLHPWTVPNAIGFLRIAMAVAFLALAYQQGSRRGVGAAAATLFFLAGVSDYADGLAARLTGQYSRLGALLDPVVDRVLVSSGVVVCFSFHLLPRWALAVLLARELLMLAVGQLWVRRGLDIAINWPGRLAVGPTLLGVFLGLVGARAVGTGWLLAGLALALLATVLYFREGVRHLKASS